MKILDQRIIILTIVTTMSKPLKVILSMSDNICSDSDGKLTRVVKFKSCWTTKLSEIDGPERGFNMFLSELYQLQLEGHRAIWTAEDIDESSRTLKCEINLHK